ncbi:MAG: hypothetical protein CMG00_01870, partial [Candidatus Marinimicrobia bacterium]|nr:hypothetical protein [Candidatus Neomarinimicrobiota bacterium]
NLNKFDLLRTFVKFTSQVIKLNVEKFILKNHRVNKLIISGGGVYNTTLVNDIKKDLDIPVFNIIDYGIEPKMKESLLMSILGYAKVNNINSNMPSVTGASNDVVLGEIYEPK